MSANYRPKPTSKDFQGGLMFNRNPYENFDFRPRRPRISTPMTIQAIGLGGFIFLWWLIPHGILFFLILPVLAALILAASFGWRQALARLIEFLQAIENRPFGGF
jgi:hypothetical protein